MADLPDDIARINALTSNARNTWFALLGVLVFVGLTLMSVEHVDFYGVDRATTLPLVNFDVPTRYFFYAAPILTSAIYGYFHLYLIRLWDALSVAEPRAGATPLGDMITPWLVTDAALHLRTRLRDDGSTTPRVLESGAMVLNILLAWGFGWGVLGAVWWLSGPARDIWMSAVGGACFALSLFVGAASLGMMAIRMRTQHDGTGANIFSSVPAMGAVLVILPLVAAITHQWTMGNADRLAPINMVGQDIVERPKGWLPYAVAKAEYRDAWCKRKSAECDALDEEQKGEFDTDWTARRAATLTDMRRPDWSAPASRRNIDWTQASLSQSFLAGADLSGAQMEGAVVFDAQMEGAVLIRTQMEGADLRWAQLEGADLRLAQMTGADLSWAQMEGADLSVAQMEGADLRWAQMEGAVHSHSRIFGLENVISNLRAANLNENTNKGGALRFVDMTNAVWDDKTDWRHSFLDATVLRSQDFETRMGAPCNWVRTELSDAEFFSLWRWWLVQLKTPDWRTPEDVLAVPLPSPERIAELGLADCEPGQPFGPMPGE